MQCIASGILSQQTRYDRQVGAGVDALRDGVFQINGAGVPVRLGPRPGRRWQRQQSPSKRGMRHEIGCET